MGESVEDLLAKMKAQYGDDRSGASQPSEAKPFPANSPLPAPASSQPSGLQQPHSIDDLLTHLEGKTPTRSQFSPPLSSPDKHASTPSLPIEFLPSVTHSTDREDPTGTKIEKIHPSKSSTDHLLNELKAQHKEREQEEQLRQQAQQQEEQRRHEAQQREEQREEKRRQEELRRQQEEQRRQQRIAVMRQAEEWLKRLDPHSGEASWFEEFATKYESRLEAAIDYLGLAKD